MRTPSQKTTTLAFAQQILPYLRTNVTYAIMRAFAKCVQGQISVTSVNKRSKLTMEAVYVPNPPPSSTLNVLLARSRTVICVRKPTCVKLAPTSILKLKMSVCPATSKTVNPAAAKITVPSVPTVSKFPPKETPASPATKTTATFAPTTISALHAPMDSNSTRTKLNVSTAPLLPAVITVPLTTPAPNAYLDSRSPTEPAPFVALPAKHVKATELVKLANCHSPQTLTVKVNVSHVL